MKKGVLLIIAGILIVALLIILVFLYFPSKQPQTSPSEECKTLKYNSEGRVNLVFFASQSEAKKYSEFLLNTYPFNQTENQFNFYYIDSYKPECELYEETAILCYSQELVKKASSCPNDYLIVLENKPSRIRSSSYMNVLSLNSAHPLSVFAHEFGHSFANLADEYTPAALPKKQENCKASCEEFGSRTECFNGCSKDSYFRSFDKGVMRTLQVKEYGPFNSNLISKKILNSLDSKITGNAIQEQLDCSTQKYYLIEGEYNSGKIKIKCESIEIGCPGNNGAGGFDYKLLMENGEETRSEFNPELVFTDAPAQSEISGEVYEYTGSFFLKIPIIETASSLEISLENKTLAKINLFQDDSVPCRI